MGTAGLTDGTEVNRADAALHLVCARVVQGEPVADADGPSEAAGTPGAPETWAASLLLLPRRAVFVVVALVQIAVEVAVDVLREAPMARAKCDDPQPRKKARRKPKAQS